MKNNVLKLLGYSATLLAPLFINLKGEKRK